MLRVAFSIRSVNWVSGGRALSLSFRSNEACDRALGSSRLCETRSPRRHVHRPRGLPGLQSFYLTVARSGSAVARTRKPRLSRFSHGIGVRYRRGVLRAHDLWAVRGLVMTRILNDFLLFSCLVMFVWGVLLAAVTCSSSDGCRYALYFMRRRDAHRADRAGLSRESGRIRAPNVRMRPLPKDRATARFQW
jgi:hypothetical protein